MKGSTNATSFPPGSFNCVPMANGYYLQMGYVNVTCPPGNSQVVVTLPKPVANANTYFPQLTRINATTGYWDTMEFQVVNRTTTSFTIDCFQASTTSCAMAIGWLVFAYCG